MQTKSNLCRILCQIISEGDGHFSDQEIKKNDMGASFTNQTGYGTPLQKTRRTSLQRADIQLSCVQAHFPGGVEKLRWRKPSIHFNADRGTAKLLQTTIIAVNQLSIYGAVAKWCSSKDTTEPVTTYRQDVSRSSRSTKLLICWRRY